MVCMGGSHHLIVRIPWIPMRFHPFPITDGNAGRVGGKQENASQVKKRLPTLSSTVKLLPLSYLTQSINGQVSEWSNEHAWKVCIRQRIGGSNPPLTAIFKEELVRKYELFFRILHTPGG